MRPLKQPSTSLFRSAELTRLMGMIVMLAVLCMIIYRARDPGIWRWLAPAPEEGPMEVVGKDGGPKDHGAGQEQVAKQEPPAEAPEAKKPDELIATGPTDEDPEEWDAALEEFEALSDRTIDMQVEEMQAYWRLVRWTQNQPQGLLRQRARKHVLFTHLMQSPDEYRGKLVHLELNVRRALRHDTPKNNKAGQDTLYELWGPTDESKSWLYVVVTPEVPAGFGIGPDVYERVTFDGYFLKLQGYHEGGAAPHAKPLSAPLLIGRITWKPAPSLRSRPGADSWGWAVNGVILAIVVASAIWFLTRKRTPPKPDIDKTEEDSLGHWLEDAGESDFVDAEVLEADNGDQPSFSLERRAKGDVYRPSEN